ncbi:MAG: hypothetical protein NCW75_06090 [Phycisphaera sp.]|nr:MAG: hypothetical protein NCW75_06090 [Phycisphaera sp.]
MFIIIIDTHLMHRRIGHTAMACPLRRRAMAFEVWEARRQSRLWFLPIGRGQRVGLDLRDARERKPGVLARVFARPPRPMHALGDRPPEMVKRWKPLDELIEATCPTAPEDAEAMRAEDAEVGALQPGCDERLAALVDRVQLADYAAEQARAQGPGQAGTALLVLAGIVATVFALGGFVGGQWWWPLATLAAAALVVKTIHRACVGGRAMARAVVGPVLSESLAPLAPTDAELAEALSLAKADRSDAAKSLGEKGPMLLRPPEHAMAA